MAWGTPVRGHNKTTGMPVLGLDMPLDNEANQPPRL